MLIVKLCRPEANSVPLRASKIEKSEKEGSNAYEANPLRRTAQTNHERNVHHSLAYHDKTQRSPSANSERILTSTSGVL